MIFLFKEIPSCAITMIQIKRSMAQNFHRLSTESTPKRMWYVYCLKGKLPEGVVPIWFYLSYNDFYTSVASFSHISSFFCKEKKGWRGVSTTWPTSQNWFESHSLSTYDVSHATMVNLDFLLFFPLVQLR